jgi:serine/threonine-protein kinase
MDDRSDEAILSKRATQLALAKTQALSARETITHRTFARDAEALETIARAGRRDEATVPAPAPAFDPSLLPRISIDERSLEGAPATVAPASRADYALVATIGEGGMGRVHLAHQRSLERDVALKTLKPDSPPAVSAALLREARVTGSLEHPGVIPVHALGIDDRGRPMLVMKRVDGVDLATLLVEPEHAAWRTRGGDRLVACVEILIQVCRTLELAHSRGVIHRDIKPANVMVGGFGEVYLLDWGIARKADDPPESEAFVGTPVYMAPEMVRGAEIDVRTDVYLLGATLHEMLTGQGRHEGKSIAEVIGHAIRSAPVTYDASVPEELARLCNRATARDPAERPQTAARFREALADFLRHRSARALCDAAIERIAKLEAVLAAAGESPPKDLVVAYRLATEARFGLTESLRAHSGEEAAKLAMRRCLAASIELELRQEHADTAQALLEEMDEPPAPLGARIAEIRAHDAARARDRERLATIDHDLDPTVEAKTRTPPLVALLLLATGIATFFGFANITPSPRGVAYIGGAVAALVIVVVLRVRRIAIKNAFNKRMTGLLVLGMLAMTANRTLGAAVDRAISETLAVDLFVFAVLFIASAITLHGPFWVAGAITLGGSILAYADAEHAVPIFVPTLCVALLWCIIVLARARKRT